MHRKSVVALTVGGLVLLGALAVFAVGLSNTQAKSRQDVEAVVHQRAVLAAALIDSLFATLQQDVPQDARRYGARAVSDRALAGGVGQDLYVALLGPTGRVLASSPGFTAQARANLAHSAALALVRSGDPYGVGNVLPYGSAGVINLAVPFPTAYGKRILLTGFTPRALAPLLSGELEKIPGVRGAHNYLLDARDTVLASTNPARPVGSRFTQPGQVAALARRSGVRNGHYYDEVSLTNSSWRLVLTAPNGPLFASVSGLRKWLPWMIFVAFGLVGAAALLLGRRVVLNAEGDARSAHERLAASAEAYRLLFENNPQAMWIFDEDTQEVFEVNDAALQLYGYARDEFLSIPLGQFRRSENLVRFGEAIEHAGTGGRVGPLPQARRDGTLFQLEAVTQQVDFDGRPGRFVMATDVTEREHLQRQLAQSQRLESLGQLAGGVAHDFNNLLGVILNYSKFVDEQIAEAAAGHDGARLDAARSDLAEIETAAQRAARLTRQLLAFARKEVIHPEVLDLNDAIGRTEELLRRTLGEHIELNFLLAEHVWPVLADGGQMEQILVNLAVNARDAMPAGGILIVETTNVEVDENYANARPGLSSGRYVQLRVSDTGTGMSPATLEQAFEPFFTTKPKGEGTGLGLATIFGIVNQAGGRVWLYSEPDVGTTCSVMLPVTEQSAVTVTDTPAEQPDGAGEVVLVVEDEDRIREVAERLLTRRGYRVLAASNGPDALELAANHDGPIDLLITDVIMPRMLGQEVARRIQAIRPGTPTLYMSGYAEPILDQGATGLADILLLEKPFTEHALLAKVQAALLAGRPG